MHDVFAHLLKYIAFYYVLINVFKTRQNFVILTLFIILSSVIFDVGNIVYYYGIAGNSVTSRMGLFLEQVQTNLINIMTVFASILALWGFFSSTRLYPKILFFV